MDIVPHPCFDLPTKPCGRWMGIAQHELQPTNQATKQPSNHQPTSTNHQPPTTATTRTTTTRTLEHGTNDSYGGWTVLFCGQLDWCSLECPGTWSAYCQHARLRQSQLCFSASKHLPRWKAPHSLSESSNIGYWMLLDDRYPSAQSCFGRSCADTYLAQKRLLVFQT